MLRAGIGRKPVRFDEAWPREPRFERGEDRIEPLDVADLEHKLALARERRQCARVLRAFGDRLFHQHMLSALEQKAHDLKVRGRRRGHGRGIDQARKFLQRGRRLAAVLPRHLLRDAETTVVDRREIDARELRENSRVIPPDVAGADDADADGI